MTEPVLIHIPGGTLCCPPMTLTPHVVEELPESATMGDLYQVDDTVWLWLGHTWTVAAEREVVAVAKPFIIGLDFDGTIVEHRFPAIGPPVPLAISWCKKFTAAGAKLLLWTIRNDGRGDGTHVLTDALEYCRINGIEIWSANVNPEQAVWSQSPKAYYHTLIDDANACCPLIYPAPDRRPYVNWSIVGPAVMNQIHAHNAAE